MSSERPDPANDSTIARALRTAGERPPLPDLDLERLGAPARAAWRARVAARAARRRRVARAATAIAAALAVAALALWLTLDRAPRGARAVTAIVERSVGAEVPRAGTRLEGDERLALVTGADEWLSVRLADGHELRLDESTRLTVSPHGRIDLERGAVYVDAAAAALEVRARALRVRHVGTRFSLRVDGERVTVAVRDGRVLVRSEADPADESFELGRGEAVVSDADGPMRSEEVPPWSNAWTWTRHAAPLFETDGARLEEFLEWAAVEGGWRLEAAPGTLVDARGAPVLVHGSVEAASLEEQLRWVLASTGLAYRVEDGTLSITDG